MLHLSDASWPLALATMAGLSTTLGAIVAVVRKPSTRSMAALLGVALGVMATVSCVELVARNAMSGEGDPFLVLAAALSGALAYYILEPLFPKMDEHHDHIKKQDDLDDHEAFFRSLQQQQPHPQHQFSGQGQAAGGSDVERPGASQRKVVTAAAGYFGAGAGAAAAAAGGSGGVLMRKASGEPLLLADAGGGGGGASGRDGAGGGGSCTTLGGDGALSLKAATGAAGDAVAAGGGGGGSSGGGGGGLAPSGSVGRGPRAGRMLRLGVLMAVTMTLHNLPEGFAVAFAAFTDFGPVMALAIALHNIPEGVIVAAPIFAATGSRWRAIGVATASGLSEPLGALLSLLLLQPFFTQERLHYLLAFVGGVMLAVCAIELWSEGRNCRNDRAFAAGILGGSLVMGWTLYVEG